LSEQGANPGTRINGGRWSGSAVRQYPRFIVGTAVHDESRLMVARPDAISAPMVNGRGILRITVPAL
jgi:hypothetical protein